MDVLIACTTGTPASVLLNSISVFPTSKRSHFGVIVVGSTLILGSREMANAVKAWVNASMKAVLSKGGVDVPGK